MLVKSVELLTGTNGDLVITAKADKSLRAEAMAMLENANQLLGAGKKLDLGIDRHREKRSLDANAYAWVLLGKLSAALPKNIASSATEIYQQLIPDVGDNFEIVPIRNDAVERWCINWLSRGKGWVTEQLPSKLDGYTNVISYYGSSTYDKAQMSRLIELIVQECRQLNIPTETPEKIIQMVSLWSDRNG